MHAQKHSSQRFLTDEGMQIDESEQRSKAFWPMHETLEPDSNVTVERDLHPRKHSVQRFSTDEAMQIDESDEQN
jgi:hypothetical protein